MKIYIYIASEIFLRMTTEMTDIERLYCPQCYPHGTNYPIMYLVLLGDDISLKDSKTYNNQTYITRTTHPFSLLHVINHHPSYITCKIHKYLKSSTKWKYKLIIGPISNGLFQNTKEIEKFEQQWEKIARKALTRMLWAINWRNQYQNTIHAMNCYIDENEVDIIVYILKHQHLSLDVKSLYDQFIAIQSKKIELQSVVI